MSFGYKKRWAPSASQRAEYYARMLAIEEAKSNDLVKDGYDINCTGDCCTGDEIAFFNPGKAAERLYGIIVADSYGAEKQQHTFTIRTNSDETMRIKGRNLYAHQIFRKKWDDEKLRENVLNEKHERGNKARTAATLRKAEKERERYLDLPIWMRETV